MTARRVFLPPDRIADGRAALTPEAVHYLRDVLRLGPGAEVEVFDGAGASYPGRLEDGLGALAEWLYGQVAHDRVVQARHELTVRGLTV